MKRRKFIKNNLYSLPYLLGLPILSTPSCEKITTNHRVVIVGAGIAGLAAANYLKNLGVGVIVLEAQPKIGGRLQTDRSLDMSFDKGASWIHGPNGNPVTNLAQDAGANMFITDDENVALFDINGASISDATLNAAETAFDQAVAAVQSSGASTQSFETVFNNLYPQYANDNLWNYMLSAYLEFDTGGDLSKLSSLDFNDDDAYNGKDKIITNGFDKVTSYLATDIDIRLEERLIRVDYQEDTTILTTNTGNIYYADYVIMTVPLGVLKQSNIVFVPALPFSKQEAISNLKMGNVNKFLLEWDTAFWDTSLQYIGYTPNEKGKFNYFINCNKFASGNFLMTFAFGDYADVTETMTDAAIMATIMDHLKAIYGNSIPNPKNMLRTKWGMNLHSFGAYSFATNGTRSEDFNTLAEVVQDKLFWAGEHTSKDYRGTVHGAYNSGLRAAEEIETLLG